MGIPWNSVQLSRIYPYEQLDMNEKTSVSRCNAVFSYNIKNTLSIETITIKTSYIRFTVTANKGMIPCVGWMGRYVSVTCHIHWIYNSNNYTTLEERRIASDMI